MMAAYDNDDDVCGVWREREREKEFKKERSIQRSLVK